MSVVSLADQTEELRSISDRQNLIVVPGYHLSVTERQLLALLLKRNHVHRDVAWTVLYAGKPECDRASPPNVDVHVSHLRKKLPIIEIRSDRANGWWLNPADKQKLNDMIAGRAQPEPTKRHRGTPDVGPIEKDIPIPPLREKLSRFQFEDMIVGDSRLVKNVTDNTVRAAVHHFRTRTVEAHKSWKFVVRNVDDGVRVWRRE